MLTDFGRKARAYRLRHDMLLYDMALIMRLGTAQLSGYECGRAEPPADVVASLDTLIRVENNLPVPEPTEEQRDAINAICALTESPRTAPTSRSRKMHAKNGGKKIEKVCNHGWQYVSAAVRAKRKIRKVRKRHSDRSAYIQRIYSDFRT